MLQRKFLSLNEFFWAFFVGGVLFEIMLDAVIAYFTGGSSLVAQVSAKISRLTAKTSQLGSKAANFGKNLGQKANSLGDLWKFIKKELDEFLEAVKSGDLINWLKKKFETLFNDSKPLSPKDQLKLKQLDAQRKRRIKKFWKDGYNPDPSFAIWGAGKISHPELWKSIIDDLTSKGCKIKYSDRNLVYGPHPSGGNPGVLTITEDASITALMHEYKHFLDDMDKGFLGFRLFQNPKLVWEMEYDAYMVEIKFLRENKEFDTATKLLENALNEKKRIEIEYNVKL